MILKTTQLLRFARHEETDWISSSSAIARKSTKCTRSVLWILRKLIRDICCCSMEPSNLAVMKSVQCFVTINLLCFYVVVLCSHCVLETEPSNGAAAVLNSLACWVPNTRHLNTQGSCRKLQELKTMWLPFN